MRMKGNTLQGKLLAGGIALILVPILIVGSFSIIRTSKALELSAQQKLAAKAMDLSMLAQETVRDQMALIKELSIENTVVETATLAAKGSSEDFVSQVDKLSRHLSNIMKAIGNDFEVLVMIGQDGVVFADGVGGTTKGISTVDRDYFKAAKQGKVSVGEVSKSKNTGNPIMPVCAPVLSPSGEFLGAVAAIIKTDFLANRIITDKVGATGYAYLVNKDGLCIAHPKKELILTADMNKVKGMEGLLRRVSAREAGVEPYVFNGDEKVTGFAPVELTGWSVLVTQDRNEFMQPVHAIRNGIVMIAGILLAISAVLLMAFSRSISKPISRIVEGLSSGAFQVASASSHVSSSSQQLAEGASEQAAALEETSSSLEEMASMMRQNAENASQANQLMTEASKVVEQANGSMTSLTTSMAEISRASEDTHKIIKTIDEIAFQTNLLALNAAVEAARAGETGAGFAVVADEVRNLAMRAADAAKNTTNLIEGTVRRVKEGSDLVAKTNEEFRRVAATVTKSGELIGEIAAASQEQAQGIEQVNGAVSDMDKVTQQNAASAEESAAASEEMNAQAEQMREFVACLVGLVGTQDEASTKEQLLARHQRPCNPFRKTRTFSPRIWWL